MDQYFSEAYKGMQRLSPGSIDSTLFALRCIPRTEEISVLEIGCGTGDTALLIAKAYKKSRVIAVDNDPDLIRLLGQKANKEGLSQQVQGLVMSMDALQLPTGQFDVILCEGAVYTIGFAQGLTQWEKFLRPGGQLIVNDLCWLKPHIAPQCVKYWKEQYPDINQIGQRKQVAESLGYEVKGHFVQPASDWIEQYYKPLADNLKLMGKKYEKGSDGYKIALTLDREIDAFLAYPSSYSYVYFMLEKNMDKS